MLAAEMRHGAHFAGLDENAAVADGCAELDNLVVACRRAAARGDVDMAVRSLEGAWAGMGLRGPFQVGVELAVPGASDARNPNSGCCQGGLRCWTCAGVLREGP